MQVNRLQHQDVILCSIHNQRINQALIYLGEDGQLTLESSKTVETVIDVHLVLHQSYRCCSRCKLYSKIRKEKCHC